MANKLYSSMNNQMNPMAQLAQQARDFRKQFLGNPRQEVERLLQTGQMSQNQFNQYSQIVQQMAPFMENN